MSIPDQHFNPKQTRAMKIAFAQAWEAMSFRYEPDTLAGARAADMLAAIILQIAAEGEVDPKILAEQALRRLPPVVSYHARAWSR